jgi:hypothetical protein
MDGLITTSTQETTYFIDGLDTAREYKEYTSKIQTDATYINGSPYNTKGDPECLSNCVSQVDCTGIRIMGTGSTQTCGLVTNMDPTKFTSDTNSKMVYLTTHGPLKASKITYY